MHRLSEQQRHALFRATLLRAAEDPGFLKRTTRGGPARAWLPWMAHWLLGTTSERLRTARYIFAGHKYRQLIEALPRDEVALIGTRHASLRYARQRGIPARSVFLERHALARNLPVVRAPQRLDRAYDALVDALTGPPGRTLILKTDINPISRLLVFAARAAGIRSVCIQHGIRFASSAPHFGDGYYADFTMVYDSHQRSVFEARGLDPARLPVLGFYESPTRAGVPPLRAGRERRICLLGQPYGRSGAERGRAYADLLRRTAGELRAAGLEPVFKPHPREMREPYMNELEPHFQGSMQDALAEFDVFLAFGSTALLEATLAGRVAIQLYDERLGGERLDAAPYAHALPAERLADLSPMCLEAVPVHNPELTVLEPQQLAERFAALAQKLDPGPPPYPAPPS